MTSKQPRHPFAQPARGLGLHVIAPPPLASVAGVSGAYPPPPPLLG